MVKLNRITEYGLISLSYLRTTEALNTATSAREIADRFHLPFEILAKTLQRLKEAKIIASTYGTRGGYVLSCDLNKLSLEEFVSHMEGPVQVVSCSSTNPDHCETHATKPCEYSQHCSIQPTMDLLNTRVQEFMKNITIEELTRNPPQAPSTINKEQNNETTHLS